MEIAIIKPTTKHVEAIAAICSAGWRQTVEGKLSEEYQNKNVMDWYNHERVKVDIEEGAYTHVALLDSRVVGVIGGGITNHLVSEVFVFYVDEKYRYKGIGRRLLNALTREQKDKGATVQWVSVQEGNEKGFPFYEAQGFLMHEKRIGCTSTGEAFTSLRYSRKI
ncbi:GNAT family N-acetyltransferase [Oceanobacillus sp. J11TS1]|uniref:GNAT family N-acetyltransferase n=1 Tax=Oceanobacillus sp. J11TS1 TaxID=2807191 RepID=UPI001B013BFE|nr:GNAT family N-acetyltransferase [Oceanobacillus sp. J11TS1]GIO22714.1 hypothetical protein J11TS1_12950 [Oceanobacillus sp. J11TS1]